MVRIAFNLILFYWAALFAALSFASSYSAVDDLGNNITLEKPAQRIVSLAPHITEVLFYIGAGNKIVGTVHYSDYPKEALKIPRIGGYDKVNLEQIMTLQPDLIVAWQSGNDSRINTRLEELGFKVYYSEPTTLKDIANSMVRLATLVGTKEIGEEKKAQFLSRYKQLKMANQSKQPLKIYYEVWRNPRYTLGGTHFSKEIFNLCSGENIFADLNEKAPIVSLEAIISRNPDVILTGDRHGEETLTEFRNHWQQWPQIKAVKKKQIYYVDADIFTRSSPRALNAAEHLCNLLEKIRTKKADS